MVISFPCNDEAGKVLLPQEHLSLTPTPSPKGEGGSYSLFFSALPAPVPLYFDGVTLKR